MVIRSKKSYEGELLIDHRAGPGLSQEDLDNMGVEGIPVRGGSMLETSTVTCNHCHKILVKNPYRIRERAYCPGCDHYICDECELRRKQTGCKSFDQFADEFLNNIVKKEINNG